MPDPRPIAAFRFGLGLPHPAAGAGAMLAALRGADAMRAAHPLPDLATQNARVADLRAARKAQNEGDSEQTRAATRAAQEVLAQAEVAAAQTLVARLVDAQDALRERLWLFWADHFTVAPRDAPARALVAPFLDEAIRPHLTAPFARMLTAATTHPAMLVYLNQAQSVGPGSELGQRRGRGLNENLARELLELHTLGLGGGYRQDDVRQLAELLTGLALRDGGVMAFDPRIAEPGAETVLGRRYGGDDMAAIRTVLADLAVHPATARHLARKLAVHFVADDPPPALVADLADVWAATGGDLAAVTAALVQHPRAADAPPAKVRPPIEFLAAALRALGVTGDEIRALPLPRARAVLIGPLRAMGQPWQTAPGPDGWPETAADWITPQGLAARLDWAMRLPATLRPDLPDPVALADRALGPAAPPALRRAVARAETRRDGVALVLASAEFNRR